MTNESLRAYLPDAVPLMVLDETDSTNREALAWARMGGAVVANRQTSGRGRLGRSFYSPEGGVYLSVIVKAEQPMTITSRAAVAVCKAIEAECRLFPGIKWVNDLLLSGRKVVGILAEGIVANGVLEKVVIGVGVNLYSGAFPAEIADTAGALYTRKPAVTRSALAAAIITRLLDMPEDFAPDYRARSCVLGKHVRFLQGDAWREGVAEDIDERGALLVRTHEGLVVLNTGEITLRLTD